MANILGIQTVGNVNVITVDSNPAFSLGTPSPVGTIALAQDSGLSFQKVRAGDTNWISYNIGLFAQTGSATPITGTTTETTLINGGVGSLSVPANGFAIGDSFQADMAGLISSKNADTITIRIKSGTTILSDSGALSLPNFTNQVWFLELYFTIRQTGVAGVADIATISQFNVTKKTGGNTESFGWNTINNTTFDTTIPNTLNITAQWSSNSAINSIYSDVFTLHKIY